MSSADSLPDHERLERLGRGRNAVVYKVRLTETDRIAALRLARRGTVLSRSPLRRNTDRPPEGMACWEELSDIDHVVAVFDSGATPRPWLLLELLDDTLTETQHELSVQELGRVLSGVGSALLAAHERGIVHLDVKPANVLLTERGKPKLSDWGEARRLNPKRERKRRPDPADSKRTPAKDVRDFGMMTYELLTGNKPYDTDSELDIAEYFSTVSLLPPSECDEEIPTTLDEPLLNTFARAPEQCIDDIRPLRDALRQAFVGEDSVSPS